MSTAETKSVTLAGVTYDVPPVPFNMCAKIIPLIDKTFPAIREGRLDEETILSVGRIVYLGIENTQELTEERFLARSMSIADMIAAALVVAQQANMKATPPGEAKGV
jgi:hypothetical protein